MRRGLAGLAAVLGLAGPAVGQEVEGHQHHTPSPAKAEADLGQASVDPGGHAGHGGAMAGALGPYPMTREASGTAWQPDASSHGGAHIVRDGWTLMGHARLNGVYDRQAGPRGDDKVFMAGMVMGMARRDLGEGGVLQLRAMLSPDPFMGRRGLPNLLSSGETADGVTPLIDRQHPHELVMELSASVSRPLSETSSVFLYAGLPGEPAFGPPAFMHRMSIMDSPEPPISHHWLDSTHITFGVVTAGVVQGDWKLEASAFRGREPDQDRYDIETPKLDSVALRLSWNPTANWSLQASWADVTSPEQLEPGDDQEKWSLSAIHTVPFGDGGAWATTAAWGRRRAGHETLDAWILESAVQPNAAWTLFARAERTETNELTSVGGHHGPTYTVAKASVGVVRDWRVSARATVGIGGLYAFNFVPAALERAYGGDPNGAMAFVRLKLE